MTKYDLDNPFSDKLISEYEEQEEEYEALGAEDLGGDYFDTVGNINKKYGYFSKQKRMKETLESYEKDKDIIEGCKQLQGDPLLKKTLKAQLNHCLYNVLNSVDRKNKDDCMIAINAIFLISDIKAKIKEDALRTPLNEGNEGAEDLD